MAPRTLPPRDLILQFLDYDPETGIFTWKPRPREMFSTDFYFRMWNARRAGKRIGTNSGRLYIAIGRPDNRFLASRIAWALIRGEPVPDEIDHADNDKRNDRIANLRASSHSQNTANAPARKSNSLGVKGVSRHRKRYVAQIQCKGIHIRLGSFDTVEEAAKVYREAAIKLHGKFARW